MLALNSALSSSAYYSLGWSADADPCATPWLGVTCTADGKWSVMPAELSPLTGRLTPRIATVIPGNVTAIGNGGSLKYYYIGYLASTQLPTEARLALRGRRGS